MSSFRRVVVIGAGVQGICVALALRNAGHEVTVLERRPRSMSRSSGRNEGKIHLGFVYANDPTLRTARILVEASSRFSPALEGWLPVRPDWAALRSAPFWYGILDDSMLADDELLGHYERVDALLAEAGGEYLGERLGRTIRLLPPGEVARFLRPGRVRSAVATLERSLEIGSFADLLSDGLAQCGASVKLGHDVREARRTPEGFHLEGVRSDGSPFREEAEIVVNCSWEDRLRLDRQIGIPEGKARVFRLKYRILGSVPPGFEELPSLTFALGPFGDVCAWPGGRMYLSWYPACLAGWSSELVPPADWELAIDGESGETVRERIVGETMRAFEDLVPGLGAATTGRVDAGVIFSWGKTDIDDPGSELHERHAIGVHAHDGWFSIDTGKLTCAPLFAERLLAKLA